MSPRTASRTALGTAHLRAAHQLLDPPPRILEDPAAVAVLGPDAEQRIRESTDRRQSPEGRALRAHMVLRSRFAEDRLAAAAGLAVPANAGFATIDFERAALAGEPWLSFFEPAEMRDELLAAGFTTVELLTPAAAEERYFRRGSSLPTPQRTTIVAAVR